MEFEKQTTALLFKEEQVEQLEEDKQFLLNELDQQVQSLPDNYITAKRKLREDYNPKILDLNTQILNVKQNIGDLKVSLVETGVDVGPAIYLARTFQTDIDTVVRFFIFILIFVFDPMAVSLVLAYNKILVEKLKDKEKYKKNIDLEKPKDIYIAKDLIKDEEKIEEVSTGEKVLLGRDGRAGK